MIKDYILSRKSILLLFISVVVLFPFLEALWGYPLDAVGYGLLLLSVFFAVSLFIDYHHYKRKRKILQKIAKTEARMPQPYPVEAFGEEKDYIAIIDVLSQQLTEEIVKREQQKQEQEEYYSLWVHQIKTPISVLRLGLQSDVLEKSMVEQEIFKIEQYVEMALSYAKLSDFSSDLVLASYDLDTLLKEAVRKCATLFIYKGLYVYVEDMQATVMTDSKWLIFVLEQILTNAAKYTAKGGVHIDFHDNVLIVKDTGIGIRDQDKERIFEMGFTGYNGRLDKNASGIGLYLAKEVSSSLGITISADSTVGKGTTISLLFPENPTMTVM